MGEDLRPKIGKHPAPVISNGGQQDRPLRMQFHLEARDFIRWKSEEGEQVRKTISSKLAEREHLTNVRADSMSGHVIAKVVRNEIQGGGAEDAFCLL